MPRQVLYSQHADKERHLEQLSGTNRRGDNLTKFLRTLISDYTMSILIALPRSCLTPWQIQTKLLHDRKKLLEKNQSLILWINGWVRFML